MAAEQPKAQDTKEDVVLHPFDLTKKLQELGLSHTEAREAASRCEVKTVEVALEWHLENAGQAPQQGREAATAAGVPKAAGVAVGSQSRASSHSSDGMRGNGGVVRLDD